MVAPLLSGLARTAPVLQTLRKLAAKSPKISGLISDASAFGYPIQKLFEMVEENIESPSDRAKFRKMAEREQQGMSTESELLALKRRGGRQAPIRAGKAIGEGLSQLAIGELGSEYFNKRMYGSPTQSTSDQDFGYGMRTLGDGAQQSAGMAQDPTETITAEQTPTSFQETETIQPGQQNQGAFSQIQNAVGQFTAQFPQLIQKMQELSQSMTKEEVINALRSSQMYGRLANALEQQTQMPFESLYDIIVGGSQGMPMQQGQPMQQGMSPTLSNIEERARRFGFNV